MAGLVVGLASVGAWLYFCSAYAGASYHRMSRLRRAALIGYLAVVTLKLTNPLHGLYFTTTTATTPLPRLVVQLGTLHWFVTAVSYALSAVGFYLLFDLFRESAYVTRQLGTVVGLAAIPIALDIAGYLGAGPLVELNYEPVGVGLFALSVLYLADGSFLAVRRFGREQLPDELDDAVVVLDDEEIVRDVNDAATRLFPELTGGAGRPLADVAPSVAAALPVEESMVLERGEAPPRYYLLSTPTLTAGETTIGRALVFTDVTELERTRRKADRQRAQLDDFAEALTHELRNTVGIVQGHLDLAGAHLDSDDNAVASKSVNTAAETADRMASIVSDLATLARFGGSVETTTEVDVAAVATDVWDQLQTDGAQLVCRAPGTVEADEPRLERLLENLFWFAAANGATEVQVSRNGDELIVADDGTALSEGETAGAFSYGEPLPDADSGMLLPVVETLAAAHGWGVSIDPDYREGVHVCIDLG
ncbi:histidine kinase N-terminal 7TM domain-containing protein [Halosegnis sp.]|uniref:histidine kinase N-terminal 7TM domain-containing protein n=1 Tax=Halosegnis sp. TaxID=2864959 RepID=UPI0035D460ED